MKYSIVERTTLKTTSNKGCRPEDSLLQTAPHELSINKDREGETYKKIIFLLKPAGMPPGAAKGNLTEAGSTEIAVVKGRQAEGTQFPHRLLKPASGKMTFGKKGIPNL